MFNEDNEELGVLIPVLLHSFFFFSIESNLSYSHSTNC